MKSIVGPSKITPLEPSRLLDKPLLIYCIKRNEVNRLTVAGARLNRYWIWKDFPAASREKMRPGIWNNPTE